MASLVVSLTCTVGTYGNCIPRKDAKWKRYQEHLCGFAPYVALREKISVEQIVQECDATAAK